MRGCGPEIERLDASSQTLDRLARERFAGQHHLQAVVLRRVVTAGHHHAAALMQLVHREVQHRCRTDADVGDVYTGGLQALGQRVAEVRA